MAAVTQAEAKLFLRIDTTDDNDLIDSLLEAAEDLVESFTGRQLLTDTQTLYLTSWASEIPLDYPPLGSITHIKYYDADSVQQTLANTVYEVDSTGAKSFVRLAYNQSWPDVRGHDGDILITYTAGYGAASAVPDGLKTAMKLLVGNWYENREATSALTMKEVPFAIRCLLWKYRVPEA